MQFLRHPIEVIQAEGPPVLIGDEFDSAKLTITYHRHYYGLGEHYNSTKPVETED
jgi:OTU domain-containing protein 6